MKFFITFILFFISAYSQNIIKPLPTEIKYDKQIVKLGRELFFDTLLSKNQDVSCASCHGIYGADNKSMSLGTKGRKGLINTPSVFNLNYHIGFFWNGRVEDLKEQITDGPLVNKHEMDNDKQTVLKRLQVSQKYIDLFKKAYGEKPSLDKMLDAIAQFEKTLITPNSKFDRFLRGEIKLSQKEEEGFKLFQSYGCISCHNGTNLGSNSFQKFGNIIPYEKESGKWEDRYHVTKNETDLDVFKVPSLRNVEKTAPYFHDGSTATLKEAIYKMAYHNVGIIIGKKEISSIEAFLLTLTGEMPETFRKTDEKD